MRLGVQGGAVPALSVWLRARPAASLALPRALRPGTAGPRGGTQRSPASAGGRAPCDSSSQRAGLARVPPPPHPWEAWLTGGALANKAGGACGRIPGPIARWRGRSPRGEKESAAESKRLVGGTAARIWVSWSQLGPEIGKRQWPATLHPSRRCRGALSAGPGR